MVVCLLARHIMLVKIVKGVGIFLEIYITLRLFINIFLTGFGEIVVDLQREVLCISIPGSVLISPTWNTRKRRPCFWAGGSGLATDLQCFLWGSLSTWPEAELTFGL